jgi:hypothetical protein
MISDGSIHLPLRRDNKRVLFPNDLAFPDVFFSDQAFSFRFVKVSYFDLLRKLTDIEFVVHFR